jgi:hypothetical protein
MILGWDDVLGDKGVSRHGIGTNWFSTLQPETENTKSAILI